MCHTHLLVISLMHFSGWLEKMNPVRRPGTAHSFVTEFEGSGQINPNPVTAPNSDLLLDIYFSPAKLVSSKTQYSGNVARD